MTNAELIAQITELSKNDSRIKGMLHVIIGAKYEDNISNLVELFIKFAEQRIASLTGL